jgi:ATP-binding cassette, subfamily B, bacterial
MSAAHKALYCASFGVVFSARLFTGLFEKNSGRRLPPPTPPAEPLPAPLILPARPVSITRRPRSWRGSPARRAAAPIAACGCLLALGSLSGSVALLASLCVGGGILVTTVFIVRRAWSRSCEKWSVAGRRASPGGGLILAKRRHPLQRLLRYTGTLRQKLAVSVAFSVLVKLIDVTPPIFVGFAITILVGGSIPWLAVLGLSSTLSQVWFVAFCALTLWVLESALQYAAARGWRDISQSIQHQLRVETYAHVQMFDMHLIESERTGELATNLNDDINQLHDFLNSGAGELVQVITNLVVIGPVFYLLAPTIAWVAVVPIPIIIWLSFSYEEFTARIYTQVKERAAILNSQLVSNIEGFATIKSFTSEEREIERIQNLSQSYRDSNRRPDALASALTPAVRTSVMIGFGGMIVLGAYGVVNGTIGAGVYGSMMMLTQRFFMPLTNLGQLVDSYQRAISALNRVIDILELPIDTSAGHAAAPLHSARGEIVLEKVGFAYPGRGPTLRNIDMRFPAGSTTAIVGPTGAGKSSIIKLLLRFYEISSGRILLDGIDIRKIDPRDLRRMVGLVSQDVFLFHGTARENIAYGRPSADDAAIEDAARIAEAHGFIDALPEGYDTILGERGARLSGGQRQRLSIARVILKDAPILILDEATASVDNETEVAIQRALARIAAERTTIIIAHRLSTVQRADHIYVLATGGLLVEQGNHSELMRRNGVYAKMFRLQTGSLPSTEEDEISRELSIVAGSRWP